MPDSDRVRAGAQTAHRGRSLFQQAPPGVSQSRCDSAAQARPVARSRLLSAPMNYENGDGQWQSISFRGSGNAKSPQKSLGCFAYRPRKFSGGDFVLQEASDNYII